MNDFFFNFSSVVHKIRYMNIHKSGLNASFVKTVAGKLYFTYGHKWMNVIYKFIVKIALKVRYKSSSQNPFRYLRVFVKIDTGNVLFFYGRL